MLANLVLGVFILHVNWNHLLANSRITWAAYNRIYACVDMLKDSHLYAMKLNDNAEKIIFCTLESWKINENNFSTLARNI